MHYHHLTIEERETIQEMLWQQSSIRRIATALNRSPSSISRELKRNFPVRRKVYIPRLSHERALKKRKQRGREQRLKNQRIREYVHEKLKRRWSPEQIANTINDDIAQGISHEAIYQYIYAQMYRGGYGTVKPGKEDLRSYLRRRRKRRIPKGT